MKREQANGAISAKMIDAVFHTAKDAFGSSEGDQPTQWIVFRVSDVKTPPLDPNSAEGKSLEQTAQRQLSDDLFGQYLAWLEDNLGTTVNQATLAQALGNRRRTPNSARSGKVETGFPKRSFSVNDAERKLIQPETIALYCGGFRSSCN